MSTDPFSDPRGQPKPDGDPFDSPDYAAFVESMVPHCRCDSQYRPCDGILAGGVCDEMHDDERHPDDSPLDEEDRNEC